MITMSPPYQYNNLICVQTIKTIGIMITMSLHFLYNSLFSLFKKQNELLKMMPEIDYDFNDSYYNTNLGNKLGYFYDCNNIYKMLERISYDKLDVIFYPHPYPFKKLSNCDDTSKSSTCSPKPIRFFISIPGIKTELITIQFDEQIISVLQPRLKALKLNLSDICCLYSGKVLKITDTPADISLCNFGTIYLTLKLKGGMERRVRDNSKKHFDQCFFNIRKFDKAMNASSEAVLHRTGNSVYENQISPSNSKNKFSLKKWVINVFNKIYPFSQKKTENLHENIIQENPVIKFEPETTFKNPLSKCLIKSYGSPTSYELHSNVSQDFMNYTANELSCLSKQLNSIADSGVDTENTVNLIIRSQQNLVHTVQNLYDDLRQYTENIQFSINNNNKHLFEYEKGLDNQICKLNDFCFNLNQKFNTLHNQFHSANSDFTHNKPQNLKNICFDTIIEKAVHNLKLEWTNEFNRHALQTNDQSNLTEYKSSVENKIDILQEKLNLCNARVNSIIEKMSTYNPSTALENANNTSPLHDFEKANKPSDYKTSFPNLTSLTSTKLSLLIKKVENLEQKMQKILDENIKSLEKSFFELTCKVAEESANSYNSVKILSQNRLAYNEVQATISALKVDSHGIHEKFEHYDVAINHLEKKLSQKMQEIEKKLDNNINTTFFNINALKNKSVHFTTKDFLTTRINETVNKIFELDAKYEKQYEEYKSELHSKLDVSNYKSLELEVSNIRNLFSKFLKLFTDSKSKLSEKISANYELMILEIHKITQNFDTKLALKADELCLNDAKKEWRDNIIKCTELISELKNSSDQPNNMLTKQLDFEKEVKFLNGKINYQGIELSGKISECSDQINILKAELNNRINITEYSHEIEKLKSKFKKFNKISDSLKKIKEIFKENFAKIEKKLNEKISNMESFTKNLYSHFFEFKRIMGTKHSVSKCHDCDAKINYLNENLILAHKKIENLITQEYCLNSESILCQQPYFQNSRRSVYRNKSVVNNFVKILRINMAAVNSNKANIDSKTIDFLRNWPFKIIFSNYTKFYGIEKQWITEHQDFLNNQDYAIKYNSRFIIKSIESKALSRYMKYFINLGFFLKHPGRKPKFRNAPKF